MKLTDGVLIMQHTKSDDGILLINPSLKKTFDFDMNKQPMTSDKIKSSPHLDFDPSPENLNE